MTTTNEKNCSSVLACRRTEFHGKFNPTRIELDLRWTACINPAICKPSNSSGVTMALLDCWGRIKSVYAVVFPAVQHGSEFGLQFASTDLILSPTSACSNSQIQGQENVVVTGMS